MARYMKNSPMRMWDVTSLRYEENPHPSVIMRIPGLSHESFDRNQIPKMTSLMWTTSESRNYAYNTKLPPNDKETHGMVERYFLDRPRIPDSFLAFMSSSEFVMSRALYDNNIRKWPLDFIVTLGNIGACSVTSVSKFYACSEEKHAPATRTLLWTNTSHIVYVDSSTRKPVRLPEWYQSKYRGRGCMDKGLVLESFDRPSVTYAHPMVVQWSDTDYYHHTNWSSYVRWATDALHAALFLQNPESPSSYPPYGGAVSEGDSAHERAKAALQGMTSDILARGLHKLHITYLRECLQGDLVEIHVWQNSSEEKELVYFSVVRDGEDICQMKMWYFAPLYQEDEEEFPF